MTTEIWVMAHHARELAADGILFDPCDDDILIAAAEMAYVPTDLAKLSRDERFTIVNAYDQVARVMI